MNIRRGDIYYADLSPVVGSEQGGIRPVLIVQNNVGNRFSPAVIAAAITSQPVSYTHLDVYKRQAQSDFTIVSIAVHWTPLLRYILFFANII